MKTLFRCLLVVTIWLVFFWLVFSWFAGTIYPVNWSADTMKTFAMITAVTCGVSVGLECLNVKS